MRIERDEAEFIGGIRGGETIGGPLAVLVRNRDHVNWQSTMDPWEVEPAEAEKRRVHAPRPGHADLAGGMKFDRRDLRDVLERASARETAARTIAGAIARELLAQFGIELRSAVTSIGEAGTADEHPDWNDLPAADDTSSLHLLRQEREPEFIEAIEAARRAGDSLGGTMIIAAHGVPPGLGSYTAWDQKLDGRIGQAILSVHAVKALVFGDAIDASRRRGSTVHDPIGFSGGRFTRESNNAGGLEGGVTNGEDVVVRVFMKPISTIRSGLSSIDIDTKAAMRSKWERSDVTAVPACAVVCEAMLAVVLADAMREKFGGDSLGEMQRNYQTWIEQLSRY